MANKVQQLPPKRSAVYHWDEWLDGNIWELIPGDDFTSREDTVRSSAYAAARERGVKVTVRSFDGKLYVQAFPEEK